MSEFTSKREIDELSKIRLKATVIWFLVALLIGVIALFIEGVKYLMVFALLGYFFTKQQYSIGDVRANTKYQKPVFPVNGIISKIEEQEDSLYIEIHKSWRDPMDVRYCIDNLQHASDFEFHSEGFTMKIESKKFQQLQNSTVSKQGYLLGILPGKAVVKIQIRKENLSDDTLEILPKQQCYAGITPIG